MGDRTSGLYEAADGVRAWEADMRAEGVPGDAGVRIGDCDICEKAEGDLVVELGENAGAPFCGLMPFERGCVGDCHPIIGGVTAAEALASLGSIDMPCTAWCAAGWGTIAGGSIFGAMKLGGSKPSCCRTPGVALEGGGIFPPKFMRKGCPG
jgi:hypothetical protein